MGLLALALYDVRSTFQKTIRTRHVQTLELSYMACSWLCPLESRAYGGFMGLIRGRRNFMWGWSICTLTSSHPGFWCQAYK
jgi:hypothetical protein